MTAKKPQETAQPVEQPVNNDCFIIMPIADHPDYKQGHFKRVYDDIFAPACEKAGYKPVRADDVAQTNLIHLDILQKLLESPMAICDLSSRNPNVLFELGLRQAFDKPTVIVREVGTPQIFDINMFRYTEYRNSLDYREVLADQKAIQKVLEETKQAVAEGRSVNSIIKLLSITNSASLQDPSNFGDKEYFQILRSEIQGLKNTISNVAASRGLNSNEQNIFSKFYAVKDDNSKRRHSYYQTDIYISLDASYSQVQEFIEDIRLNPEIYYAKFTFDNDDKPFISIRFYDSQISNIVDDEIQEISKKHNIEIISINKTLVIG